MAHKNIDAEAMQAIEDLANNQLLPVADKIDGLSGLFFCETRGGREYEGTALNGISLILKGLSVEIHSIYDKLHVIIK